MQPLRQVQHERSCARRTQSGDRLLIGLPADLLQPVFEVAIPCLGEKDSNVSRLTVETISQRRLSGWNDTCE